MKRILVRYCEPEDVMEVTNETTDEEIKQECFIISIYEIKYDAEDAYANSRGWKWARLFDDKFDVKKWIDEAYEHIKAKDTDWLEKNFT
jgi:hypothetical protein